MSAGAEAEAMRSPCGSRRARTPTAAIPASAAAAAKPPNGAGTANVRRYHGTDCRRRRERTFVHDEVALLDASHDHPAEQAAWREEIHLALMRLEPEQREAFLLKHVEDLGYDEMAEITGVGVSALKMRVKRACERLRVLLHEVQGD